MSYRDKTTATISISAYPIRREKPESTQHFRQYDYAVVADCDSTIGGYRNLMTWLADEWAEYGGAVETATVEIQLPDGVQYGEFNILGTEFCGFHGQYYAPDGWGKAVLIYCAAPKVCGDAKGAIKAAIESGIIMAVPNRNGGRDEIVINPSFRVL